MKKEISYVIVQNRNDNIIRYWIDGPSVAGTRWSSAPQASLDHLTREEAEKTLNILSKYNIDAIIKELPCYRDSKKKRIFTFSNELK